MRALLSFVIVWASIARADPEIVYRVSEGETLSHVALRFHVTLADLERWNPGLDERHVRIGQELHIDTGQRRVDHEVQRGESLSSIAAHWEVSITELQEWNRSTRRGVLRAGQHLIVYTRVPDSRSQSIGSPDHGRLQEGRPLPPRHPAFFVRTPSRAFGTDETVRWIVDAFDALHARDPRAPRIEIHDLSVRGGGPLAGHHSHESGRDADVAYYQTGCNDDCAFHRIAPDDLDVARQWRLFEHWLRSGEVEAIFMDHALQGPLYRYARSIGVSRALLGHYFQYPRGPEDRMGVIRHHPRHADHFHVRFVCHDSDESCRSTFRTSIATRETEPADDDDGL